MYKLGSYNSIDNHWIWFSLLELPNRFIYVLCCNVGPLHFPLTSTIQASLRAFNTIIIHCNQASTLSFCFNVSS